MGLEKSRVNVVNEEEEDDAVEDRRSMLVHEALCDPAPAEEAVGLIGALAAAGLTCATAGGAHIQNHTLALRPN